MPIEILSIQSNFVGLHSTLVTLQVKSVAQAQLALIKPGRAICSSQVQRQLPVFRARRAGQCIPQRLQRICHSNTALPLRARFTTNAAAAAEPAAEAPAEEHQYQAEVNIFPSARGLDFIS